LIEVEKNYLQEGRTKLYVGIDLHSNNSVLVIVDENDKAIYSIRLPSDTQMTLRVHALYVFYLINGELPPTLIFGVRSAASRHL